MPSSLSPPTTATDRLRSWLEYPLSSGPTVSADGRWLYFLSNRNGVPQAWGTPIDGGPVTCLSETRENVLRVEASPEGSAVLLAVDRGGDEHWQLYVSEGDAPDTPRPIRALTQDPTRIHQPGAWRDGAHYVFSSNRRDVRFFDVYEAATTGGGAPRLVRQQDALVEALAARGQRVLLSRSNTNLDVDLILLDGERESLLTPHSDELTVRAADLAQADVLAAANPDREFASLVRYHAGGTPEVLAEFAGDVETVKTDPEGTRVAFAVNRDGWSELHVLDTRSNEGQVLNPSARGVVTSVAWIPDGRGFVFDLSSPTAGQEVWRADLGSRTERQITASPVPLPGPVTEPSLHAIRAEDGLTVPYWEYAPTGEFVRGTIVNVHGGPEAQARPEFARISAFLVAEGWRVILPNVRGSLGYGRTYVHLDDVRKRMDSVRDLRDLVRTLVTEGKAQPGRIGILGGSYGGFMVLAAISTYPDLWGAAVDVVGIANFVTFLERTGPWRRKVREDEYGSLERDREFLESISPVHHADRIVAPLMVVHGNNDPRVPVYEAEQIVATLRSRGVPVEFLRYDNEGHGLKRRENQLESYGRAAEFFARHLTPA